MEEFLEHARRAYGDLRKPDYGFFSDALRVRPWEPLVDRLRQLLLVEDWTDREDDVSFSYVLQVSRDSPAWSLWLSAVGPFALLACTAAGAELVRSDVVVGTGPDMPPEGDRVLALLREAGVRLLSAEEVETTVDGFRAWNGRVLVSLFFVLFGETDVPWWHAS
uniref:Uncharacterized protein n=1 Tax=Amycolatopsis orientalis subsp. vinearia TaxID=797057 RepID=A0A023GXN2_AMYOR|nr:hypothetical protein [Amycolatopsis orientalis subsp. vinearia]